MITFKSAIALVLFWPAIAQMRGEAQAIQAPATRRGTPHINRRDQDEHEDFEIQRIRKRHLLG